MIVSGPIVHHSQYMDQLDRIKKLSIPEEKVKQGIISLSLGYGKKILVASQLGSIVDFGYSNIDVMSAGAIMICVVSYALQLYFDFSGYCNIVEGVGLMMGFELPINFVSPYKSVSIADFWKRWHKTLTKFLTQYIYIPLGGNQKGKCRQSVNILVVFLVSGLWHGASVTFLLWGGVHGICMVLDKCIGAYWNKLGLYFRKGVMFILVTVLWIPFRADSLTHTLNIFYGLIHFRTDTAVEFYQTMIPQTASIIMAGGLMSADALLMLQKILIILFVVGLLFVVFVGKDVTYLRERYSSKIWMVIICGVILSISVMQFSAIVPSFIYEGF